MGVVSSGKGEAWIRLKETRSSVMEQRITCTPLLQQWSSSPSYSHWLCDSAFASSSRPPLSAPFPASPSPNLPLQQDPLTIACPVSAPTQWSSAAFTLERRFPNRRVLAFVSSPLSSDLQESTDLDERTKPVLKYRTTKKKKFKAASCCHRRRECPRGRWRR